MMKEKELKIVREDIIKFRVTAFEKIAIQLKADETGLSISEYVRRCALHRHLPTSMTDAQAQAYLILKRYEANFKKISSIYAQKNEPELKREILALIKELQAHLNDLTNGK